MSKLIVKRLKPITGEKLPVLKHYFGIRRNHPTIDQVHPNTEIIEKTLEKKGVCSTVLGIA
jgi:hypothetical protein